MDVGANIQAMPFPWYDDVEKQNHRKAWVGGQLDVFKLVTPYYKLPPFMIKRAAIAGLPAITEWKLINIDTASETNLLPLMQADTLEYYTTGSVDYIVYTAANGFTSTLPSGYHYCRMSDGTNTWYSEVVFIDCFVDAVDAGGPIGLDDLSGLLVDPDDFLLASLNNFVLP